MHSKENTTILRHKFFRYKQNEGQAFMSFVTELKRLSGDCEFGTLKDLLIKDVVIIGVLEDSLRERMPREPDIELTKAVQRGQACEESKKHTMVLKMKPGV